MEANKKLAVNWQADFTKVLNRIIKKYNNHIKTLEQIKTNLLNELDAYHKSIEKLKKLGVKNSKKLEFSSTFTIPAYGIKMRTDDSLQSFINFKKPYFVISTVVGNNKEEKTFNVSLELQDWNIVPPTINIETAFSLLNQEIKKYSSFVNNLSKDIIPFGEFKLPEKEIEYHEEEVVATRKKEKKQLKQEEKVYYSTSQMELAHRMADDSRFEIEGKTGKQIINQQKINNLLNNIEKSQCDLKVQFAELYNK